MSYRPSGDTEDMGETGDMGDMEVRINFDTYAPCAMPHAPLSKIHS